LKDGSITWSSDCTARLRYTAYESSYSPEYTLLVVFETRLRIFTTSTSPKYNGEIYQEYPFNHFTSHNECPLCRIITYIVSKSKAVEDACKSSIILNFQHSHCYVDVKTGLRNYLPKLLVGLKTDDFGFGPGYFPPSLDGMDGLAGQIQLILEPTLGDQTDGPNPLLFGRRVF
jgi:hypothetical protein